MKNTGNQFMEYTKYPYMEESKQAKGVKQPSLELPYGEEGKIISLPKPEDTHTGEMTVREAVENRRSIRQYSHMPITHDELSFLLWCTQGVKEVLSGRVTIRTVPSAGARHAFETYLLVNNIAGLQPGLYRYLALDHKLGEVNMNGNIAEIITAGCLGQGFIMTSAATFIWVAVAERMTWRYGERGYRYLHLDAGHVCQNLYLAAESINCGVCAIAAFDDDEMNSILNLDGENQFVIYVATVGKK